MARSIKLNELDIDKMHAGTPAQEQALDAWHESQQSDNKITLFDFERDSEYLKSIGLLEDTWHGEPFQYGSEWLIY